jgi:ABC-type phosphate/phosphonate transport system permease subunit
VTLLALISGGGLAALLWEVCKWGIIFWVLWWALGVINPPEPWKKVATVILVILTVVVIIDILNGTVTDHPRFIHW